jgi:hypothetical protein
MTRRERLERKVERRQDWAESAARKSDAGFAAAHKIADGIPLGQPILVGHHSERHARRDVARIDSGMRKGVEMDQLAKHHRSKAAGLASQLETTIFSDDPDAIEALQARAAALDAEAAQEVAVNKAWRKGKGQPGWADGLGLTPELLAKFERTMALCPYFKGPCFSTNTRANARRLRERIKQIEFREARAKRAEEAGGCLIIGEEYINVVFAEKPAGAILDALKAAGFSWGGGQWHGYRSKLPAEVLALVEKK